MWDCDFAQKFAGNEKVGKNCGERKEVGKNIGERKTASTHFGFSYTMSPLIHNLIMPNLRQGKAVGARGCGARGSGGERLWGEECVEYSRPQPAKHHRPQLSPATGETPGFKHHGPQQARHLRPQLSPATGKMPVLEHHCPQPARCPHTTTVDNNTSSGGTECCLQRQYLAHPPLAATVVNMSDPDAIRIPQERNTRDVKGTSF